MSKPPFIDAEPSTEPVSEVLLIDTTKLSAGEPALSKRKSVLVIVIAPEVAND